jgi:MFS family permease
MGRVGQDWLVLTVLTAGSATALGVVTGLQFLPFLLLAPWAGLIADRFRKRRILLATQTVLAVSSLLLGVLAVALARRARSRLGPTLGRPKGRRTARLGRLLGILGLMLALTAAGSVGIYELLSLVAD